MEFLGNKVAMLPVLREVFAAHVEPGSRIADVFCGTSSVSSDLRARGYAVDANDLLPLCATWARATLQNPERPGFAGLVAEVPAWAEDPYGRVIEHLASLEPVTGWVTRRYTPCSAQFEGVERRYLTVENGRRIDSIRAQIEQWRPLLTDAEHALLIATLIAAVVKVSNVAGTYGCYLKEWKPRALRQLALNSVQIRPGDGDKAGHRVWCSDAEHVVSETEAQLIYADPPYTKRQYAAYYHLLNTLVGKEDPNLSGSTGLPCWQEWASEWCYARRAPYALDRLIAKSSAPTFVLSYSSDGHIAHATIMDILSRYGTVSVRTVERRRYRSSRLAHRAPTVLERVYVVC
jgi:adenine-specific DNA-methyltransferase